MEEGGPGSPNGMEGLRRQGKRRPSLRMYGTWGQFVCSGFQVLGVSGLRGFALKGCGVSQDEKSNIAARRK